MTQSWRVKNGKLKGCFRWLFPIVGRELQVATKHRAQHNALLKAFSVIMTEPETALPLHWREMRFHTVQTALYINLDNKNPWLYSRKYWSSVTEISCFLFALKTKVLTRPSLVGNPSNTYLFVKHTRYFWQHRGIYSVYRQVNEMQRE